MAQNLNPEAIVLEMQNERRSQNVASFGWMPHPEDVQALGEACARRQLRHIAAGLDEQEGVEVSVDEPDWETLERACGDVVEREPHIREVFERAWRETIEQSDTPVSPEESEAR